MDRLSLVVAIIGLTVGCGEEDGRRPGAVHSRVESVAQAEGNAAEEFCDVTQDADAAPQLTFPPLASGTAPGAPSGARWLNVWATWCRPCVEELPMLVEWSHRMRGERTNVELVFLSNDATDEAVTTFRSQHPNAPESLRIADPAALQTWVTTVGLDAGATLPIHIFTDSQGRVRCARTGAIAERDYENVQSILSTID